MEKLVVASNNKGKIAEIKTLLGGCYDVCSLSDEGIVSDPEESGLTFEDNALIKAKAVYDVCHCATLADDSGLIVDALGGQPGVRSARYAGEHATDNENKKLLLEKMSGITNRDAQFECVVAFINSDGNITVAHGSTEGSILTEEHGVEGFGYDPLFYSYDLQKPFGLASADEKNEVSHRARALRNLMEKLPL